MAGPVTGSPGTGSYYQTGKAVTPAGSSGGRFTVKTSMGGRVNARAVKAAKGAVASKGAHVPTPTNLTTVNPATSVPGLSTSGLEPEDIALNANYNPNQLNMEDNTKIAGLAGKIQLPNALNYANSMANLQYGPTVVAQAQRIKGLTQALPGALQALSQAFANINSQTANHQLTNPTASGQGVANLFGGNTSAAAVAANQAVQAGATADNETTGLNNMQDASNQDQADWATRINLLNNMAVNSGRSDLIASEGQLNAAKKGYYDQALQTRGNMISQAISNQGAINNQRLAAALAGGQLESEGLTNEGKALQNSILGVNAANAPTATALQNAGTKQNIIDEITTNNINAKTASAQLTALSQQNKKNGGVTSMADAFKAGGGGAVDALIIPTTALIPTYDAAGNPTHYGLVGNPNNYFQDGVKAIMAQLPGSSRARVRQYVANKVNAVVNQTGGKWAYKGGRWVQTGAK